MPLLCNLDVGLLFIDIIARRGAGPLQLAIALFIIHFLVFVALAVEQVLCALNHGVGFDVGAIERFILDCCGFDSFDLALGVSSPYLGGGRLLD